MKPVWIVDDDQSMRWVLEKALARAGVPVQCFPGAAEMLEALEGELPAVLVTDIRMPGMDGLALLQRVKREHPGLPVIVMTAFTDLNSTVAAFQKGAFDYLPKPFDVNAAVALIQRATRGGGDAGPAGAGGGREEREERTMMQSSAPAMQEVFRAIGRLATSSVTVLITGESGTGKELVARALHDHGSRADGPFVGLNAAAIPKDLLEAELFGHERGAFTGATQQRRGRFEEARGGTLFLDEIGDMPFDLQTRLLRVLAEGSFYRVGGSQAVRADVRIIAATHQPLEQRVAEGRFREDLFHRLNVIRLRLPPLRERKEDIPALAELFLRNSARDLNVAPRQLAPAAMEALMAFSYPGNIRQLENFCQWLTVMSSSQWVELKDLPPEVLEEAPTAGSAVAAAAGTPAAGNEARSWPVVQPSGGHSSAVHPSPVPPAAAPIASAHPSTMHAPAIHAAAVQATAPALDAAMAPLQEGWSDLLMDEVRLRLARNEPAIMATLEREFERVLIGAALSHCRGRRVEAAHRLGIGRNTLTRKCAELGIDERET